MFTSSEMRNVISLYRRKCYTKLHQYEYVGKYEQEWLCGGQFAYERHGFGFNPTA